MCCKLTIASNIFVHSSPKKLSKNIDNYFSNYNISRLYMCHACTCIRYLIIWQQRCFMKMTMNVECKQLSYGLILHGTLFLNTILYIDTIVRYTEI